MTITFKQFLHEQSSGTFVFAFGRYSPPTRGHVAHFQHVKDYAKKIGAPYTVYVSKKVDHKRNPVPVEEKVAYIKKAIPDLHIEPAVNMFTILGDLIERGGITDIVYFAGGDYFTDQAERAMFDRLQMEAQKVGINLKVQSSGERTEGISGTALRQAVVNNDFKTFLHASPVGIGRVTEQDVARMFEITKQGLATVPKTRSAVRR